MRSAVLLAVACSAACGGDQVRSTATSANAAPASEPTDPRAQVAQFVDHQDQLLSTGKTDAWLELWAADSILIATAPGELYVGRAAIAEHFRATARDLAKEGGGLAIAAKGDRHIGVAPDGKAAWTTTEMELTLRSAPKVTTVLSVRVTQALVRTDAGWQVVAAMWSVPVTDAEARDRLAQGTLVPPAPIANGIGAGTEPLLDMLRAFEASPRSFAAQVSSHRDAVLLGPAAGSQLVGSAIIYSALAMPESLKIARRDGVRAQVAPGGQLAWVVANLDTTFPGHPAVTIPYRWMGAYLREGAEWKLVQTHLSIGW